MTAKKAPKLTPKVKQARKLQRQYLGFLRSLAGADRAKVKQTRSGEWRRRGREARAVAQEGGALVDGEARRIDLGIPAGESGYRGHVAVRARGKAEDGIAQAAGAVDRLARCPDRARSVDRDRR